MNPQIVLIVFRLIAASIFAAGTVWLASEGKDGWGWCAICSIVLGTVEYRVDGGVE